MARIMMAGFETGDTQQIGADAVGSSAGAVSIASATPTARSGTYSLKTTVGTPNNGLTWQTWLGKKAFTHASKTELYYGFGMRAVHGSEPAAGSTMFLVIFDTAGNVNLVLTLDSGTIRAYVATAGTTTPSFGQTTLIAAASSAMSMDAWHLIEVHVIAATGATGTFEVKLDGVSVISATSQRTAQANANMGSFFLGMGAFQSIAGIGSSSYHAFDDLRVNDTTGAVNNSWPGDEKIVMLTPNAAGDSTQWSRGGADSGNNYGQVDEIPPNGTTDYVYDSTVGHLDLYNLTTQAVQAVSAVNVIMQAFNADGAGGSIDLVTKTGAGQSDGSAQSLTGAPTYYNRLLETDPADSGTWTQTKIDALQVGPKLAS